MKRLISFMLLLSSTAYADRYGLDDDPSPSNPGGLLIGIIVLAILSASMKAIRRRSEDLGAVVLGCFVIGLAVWVGSKGGWILGLGSSIGFCFIAAIIWSFSDPYSGGD